MMALVSKLALLILAHPGETAVAVGLVGDALGVLVKRAQPIISSHRWAYARDAYRYLVPRLGPGALALAKMAWGAKHPEVVKALGTVVDDAGAK